MSPTCNSSGEDILTTPRLRQQPAHSRQTIDHVAMIPRHPCSGTVGVRPRWMLAVTTTTEAPGYVYRVHAV
jgi:hypothetical protein